MSEPTVPRRDRGSVLLLVLVATVVLSLVVVSVSSFVATGLSYGGVVESRADRLAAADGGMRYAVERLRLGASRICATNGGDSIDPPDLNGATVSVSCAQVGNGFDDTNGWALILTGEEIPTSCSGSDCALIRTSLGVSNAKLVGGPTYMARADASAFDLKALIEFRYSQLLYSASDCQTSSLPTLTNLTFDSTSLGFACTERPWNADAASNGLFSEPNTLYAVTDPATQAAMDQNPAPSIDGNGCTIFFPGYYDIAPPLGSHNYFMSGDYVFDGFALEIKQAKITAGRAAITSSSASPGDTQFIPNTSCNTARNTDPGVGVTTAGATFYMQNSAQLVLEAHGSLEIMRRKQGRSYVSIHAIDDSYTYDTPIIEQGPGTNKDLAVHGLIWAPEARITFTNVTNTANGQLRGGAVISNADIRASASADEFLIAVEPSDLHGTMVLDSVATKDGNSTTIRSVVDYRPSTNYAAVTSWRVID